jgi:hypothetical protein
MVHNSTTTKARVKISTDLEFLEFLKSFDAGWAKFKNKNGYKNFKKFTLCGIYKTFYDNLTIILIAG